MNGCDTLRVYAPEFFEIVHRLQHHVHLLESLPLALTHHDFSQANILVNDSGNVTGVIDFDEAGIEAFGMYIWGLYECFFGSMEDGKWSSYDEMPVLANAFWNSPWSNTPPSLKLEKAETAVEISLSTGVTNRYFIDGMMEYPSDDDCTVAWICALQLKMIVAETMLDQLHYQLHQPKSDHSSILGIAWTR